jgi:tetratricopeptide (TPR) repeat protein
VKETRRLDAAATERQLLVAAIERHNAGQWRQADQLYGHVVGINRRNHEALHRWALLKQAQGQHRDALQLLDKAIHVNPNAPFAHCHRGYVLQDLGRRKEAIASFERAIQLESDLVDAHIGLGTLHAELGDVEAACASFDKAAAIDPRVVEAVLNKGILFETHGQLDEAVETFDAALRIAPGHPVILQHKAASLRRKGELTEALRVCDAALAMRRDGAASMPAPAMFEKGLILTQSNRHADAIVAFEGAAAMRHAIDACHYNIGNCLKRMGRLGDARVAYLSAIAIRADHVEAFNDLGDVLRGLHRPFDALAAFEKAISIKPNYTDALINRAEVLFDLDRQAEAFAAYDHIVTHWPDSAGVFNSLGIASHALGRYDEALAQYGKALSIDPKHVNAWYNAGIALRVLGRYDAALIHFARAVAVKPDFADAHYNAAMCKLEAGDFAAGWPLYEWRLQATQRAPRQRKFAQPLWLGDRDIAGKTILLWTDEGAGDMMQMARYAPLLSAQGARVVLEAWAPLARLLERMTGISEVVAYGENLPEFDLHCPIMSLPLAFKTTLDTIPADIPYLRADDARVVAWRERLAALPGRKVGLTWAGNPHYPLDKHRSIALSQLAPLGSVRDVTFVSLQKSAAAQQAATQPVWELPTDLILCDWTAELIDFDDTAALIAALDLVISVDTATVHLAGALGKPVWMLNRYDTCWRWLRDRDDSPWYPSLRLFRQLQPGDWAGVVERVRTELERA